MVKLVDTADLKSAASRKGAYGFDPHPGHHAKPAACDGLQRGGVARGLQDQCLHIRPVDVPPFGGDSDAVTRWQVHRKRRGFALRSQQRGEALAGRRCAGGHHADAAIARDRQRRLDARLDTDDGESGSALRSTSTAAAVAVLQATTSRPAPCARSWWARWSERSITKASLRSP